MESDSTQSQLKPQQVALGDDPLAALSRAN
jgi:hypothetical protein